MEAVEKLDTSKKKEIYPITDKPWLKFFTKETLEKPFEKKSMYQWIYDFNKDYPDEIALQYLGINITYKQLFENIKKVSDALKGLGVEEGEIVTLAMPSTPEVVYLIYALNRIGAVANIIHPLPSVNELHFYLEEVQSRFFFMFDGTYDLIRDTLADTPVEKAIIVSPAASLPVFKRKLYRMANKLHMDKHQCMEWEAFLKLGNGVDSQAVERDHDAMALISHTGGTTGDPKGVMLSDNNENAEVFQIINSIPNERQKVMMLVLPPFVNYSFTNGIHEGLSVGCKVALLPKYEVGKYHEYHKQYQPNYINSIPAYVLAMTKEKELRNMDLSSLEFLVAGGEAMDASSEKAVNDFLHSHGCKSDLQKGYGATEMVSGSTVTRADVNVPDSAGIPMFMLDASAFDLDTNEPLPVNKKGELCFSGPTICLGYYKNQKSTDKLIHVHKDGKRWLHTGDIGFISEDGDIFITGRIKRIIMTKGKDGNPTKMFPDRIERTIQRVKAVNACCVVGVKDPKRIHIPRAFIELRDPNANKKAIKKEILNTCKNHLPEYQVPSQIVFVDKLPRTPRGKIDYKALDTDSDVKE